MIECIRKYMPSTHPCDLQRRGSFFKCLKLAGEPSWIRTSGLLIKSQLLYRLSYGPTLGRELAARTAAGKALSEVPDIKSADPPGRCNDRERLEDETSLSKMGMGHAELARAELAPAP